jgi:hypothetical protein
MVESSFQFQRPITKPGVEGVGGLWRRDVKGRWHRVRHRAADVLKGWEKRHGLTGSLRFKQYQLPSPPAGEQAQALAGSTAVASRCRHWELHRLLLAKQLAPPTHQPWARSTV